MEEEEDEGEEGWTRRRTAEEKIHFYNKCLTAALAGLIRKPQNIISCSFQNLPPSG